jgi:hypothetical protein
LILDMIRSKCIKDSISSNLTQRYAKNVSIECCESTIYKE